MEDISIGLQQVKLALYKKMFQDRSPDICRRSADAGVKPEGREIRVVSNMYPIT